MILTTCPATDLTLQTCGCVNNFNFFLAASCISAVKFAEAKDDEFAVACDLAYLTLFQKAFVEHIPLRLVTQAHSRHGAPLDKFSGKADGRNQLLPLRSEFAPQPFVEFVPVILAIDMETGMVPIVWHLLSSEMAKQVGLVSFVDCKELTELIWVLDRLLIFFAYFRWSSLLVSEKFLDLVRQNLVATFNVFYLSSSTKRLSHDCMHVTCLLHPLLTFAHSSITSNLALSSADIAWSTRLHSASLSRFLS